MIAQLHSPSLLRFWRTGADRHLICPDDDQQVEFDVLKTSSLHNEFDNFKQSHKEQTKRGYRMFPLNELLKLWNNERETPSPQIILFRKTYLHLEANEIDDLCDWFGNKQDI